MTRRIMRGIFRHAFREPPGSRRWCIAVHAEACTSKHHSQSAVDSLQAWLSMLRYNNNFTKLLDADDEPFATWEDFVRCREPFGLGMRVEVAKAVLEETDIAYRAPDLAARMREN